MSATKTIEALLAEREAWEKERITLQKERAALQQQARSDLDQIKHLRQIIADLKNRLFGNKRGEHIDEAQLLMQLSGLEGSLVQLEAKEDADALRRQEQQAKPEPAQRRPRFVFPERMEETTEVIEPDEVLAEPDAYRQIGQERTEILDIVPMKFIKKTILRPRYVRIDQREAAPICAPAPARVLAGGLPSVRLLVYVLLAKYMDHLPLYRISKIFKQRYEVALSRQTMADWVRSVAEDWLSLIYHSIKSDLQSCEYLHGDETPVTCNDPDVKGRSHNGYLWVYVSPEGDVFYDWHMSRNIKAAESMLSGYRGLLQCDGYKVYDSLARKEGFKLVGCMAHVRRKFFEAFDVHGEDASAWYLVQIKKLYAVERKIREENAASPRLRQDESRPLMQALRARMEQDQEALEENGQSRKTLDAIRYGLGQWDALVRYLDHPQASIDNNRAEQAIRPVKLGAKNWLFVGHPKAGKRSAIIYTLIENCKQNGIDPQLYLQDVLEKLPTYPSDPDSIRELQPRFWKKKQNKQI